MQILPISEIRIEDRQRRHFDEKQLGDLIESIDRHGLLHPIVVRRDGHLVAGERRLRACSTLFETSQVRFQGEALPADHVPVVYYESLDSTAAFEAELEENIKRADLTWQERADAIAKLHNLRSSQRAEVGAVQTIADTALEVLERKDGAYQDEIRKQVIVAKHLANPAVAKAKTLDDAFKVLKMEERRQQAAEVAATLPGKSNRHEIIQGNCLEWLAQPCERRYDVLVCDPPYGISVRIGYVSDDGHDYDDSPETFRSTMVQFIPLLSRVMKPDSHAYLFCDFSMFAFLKVEFLKAGWEVYPRPMVWNRGEDGRPGDAEKWPRRGYENILYARLGSKPLRVLKSDVISHPADKTLREDNFHGAKKPAGLMREILTRSVGPGEWVLDPFAGSGPVLEAAHEIGCFTTSIEIEPTFVGLLKERLSKLL